MKRRIIHYKNWTIKIRLKETTDGLIPFSFNIYYLGQKVNSTVPQHHLTIIQNIITEHYGEAYLQKHLGEDYLQNHKGSKNEQ